MTQLGSGAINNTYDIQQKQILRSAEGKKLDIIGDGRFDSPGNSAKYGTYTIMDSETDKVLSFFHCACYQCWEFSENGGVCL